MSRIRKAVFPVGGLGTGILPATKAAPKELFPVVDKPLIQYVVEEVLRAGVRQLILITSRTKRAIEDHFDKAYELETALALHNRYELLAELRRLFPHDVSFQFVRQPEPLGTGHALLCARTSLGDEPFLVVAADELIDAPVPAAVQLLDAFDRFGHSVVAVTPAAEAAPGAARLTGTAFSPGLYRIAAAAASSPRRPIPLALAGRCVLTPGILDYLATTPPGPDGEIDLADALAALAAHQPVIGRELAGERFDCGTKLGYLSAILHFGMRHPVVGEPFATRVRAAAAGPAVVPAPVHSVAAPGGRAVND
jgi:UTP--glucose-1-phosphate uridylyltransferase